MCQRGRNRIVGRILTLATAGIGRQLLIGAIIVTACGLVGGAVAGESSRLGKSPNTAGAKVLHFPADRPLGELFVEHESDGWHFFGPAQGDVVVPADRNIKLTIHFREPRPNDLSGLSKLGSSDLHELSLDSWIRRTPANRPALESISHLTGLQILSLYQTGIDSRQMSSLKSLSSLRSLVLVREHSVGSAGLAVLKDLPALEYLDCDTAAIHAGLEHIGQLVNLKRLRLRMGRIKGPGLAELANMPRLERLTLWGTTGLTDQHIRHLEGLTRLKSLTLWGTDIPLTDVSLASISKLTALEELHFIRIETKFTDAGVGQLANLTNLRILGLGSHCICDAGVLAGMGQLESVSGIDLTSKNMKALAGLGNLKSLGLALEGPMSGSAGNPVAMLGELKSLEKLNTGSWSVHAKCFGDEELAFLESLNGLKDLSIPVEGLTDRGLASIGKLGQLESLSLIGVGKNNRLSKRGLNQLNGLSQLQKLSMSMPSGVWSAGDNTALNLSGLTNLKRISLISIGLQGSDWAFLADQENLEELWLNNCGVCSENGLRYIKDLPKLKALDLQNVTCTEGNGLAVLGGLKSLESIRLIGRITDRALGRLPMLASVRLFDVETDVTIYPETIARLRQVLPCVSNVNVKQPSQESRAAMQSAPQRRSATRPRQRRKPK